LGIVEEADLEEVDEDFTFLCDPEFHGTINLETINLVGGPTPWMGSRSPMGWWFGLAPATLEFWIRFPNERNQGKQAHPVLKYRVLHGSISPRSLVRGGPTSPHKPRLVVSQSTSLPLPPSPHANSFALGPTLI